MDSLREEMARLEGKETFKPTLELLHRYIRRYGPVEVFNCLSKIMRESQPLIEAILDNRVRSGTIKDKNQARKSIAGHNFQHLIFYLIGYNVLNGNLPSNLLILKSKTHRMVRPYTQIKVGEEVQKPDIDLVVLTEKENDPIIIYSCKTSLRERGGQTYRWKILVDITTHCPQLVEKYALSYPSEREVLTGFITADFYDEINSPQQRGMLKFFDFSYVSKPLNDLPDGVKRLSAIVEDLREIYGQ